MGAVAAALIGQALQELESYRYIPKYVQKANIPSTRRGHAAAPLSNDRVLVVGGLSPSGSYLTSVLLYDATTDTWSSRASIPTGVNWPAAAPLSGDRVLLAGGYDGSNWVATVLRYDLGSNAWTTRASLPSKRYMCAAATLSNNRVLVIGGYNGSSYLKEAVRYDDAANSWTQRAQVPSTPYDRPSAAPLSGDRILFHIGDRRQSVYCYTDSTNSWASVASPSLSRSSPVLVPLSNDRVLLIGDENAEEEYPEVYDVSLNKWKMRPRKPLYPRMDHAAAPLSGDRAVIIGGQYWIPYDNDWYSQDCPYTEIYIDDPMKDLIQTLATARALALAGL